MKQFLKSRWMDFRVGHNTYTAFLIGVTNFLILTFNFIVLKLIPGLPDWFILVYLIAGATGYIPIAIFFGYWHIKTQARTEQTRYAEKNPYFVELRELAFTNEKEVARVVEGLIGISQALLQMNEGDGLRSEKIDVIFETVMQLYKSNI